MEMEIEYRNNIYDRLLEIRFKINFDAVPNPGNINQKIGECHGYIEEVEHFSIRVSKEISVKQQALNNVTAEYESKKDMILIKEEIKNLPSFKDREAAANMILRDVRVKVTEYENEVVDLNNLLKAITLKIRNLNRANNDIKMQLRLFEAQTKITGSGPGSGPSSDYAAKSIMEEMEKSVFGDDSFGEAESEEEEAEKVEDPSDILDVENLLAGKEDELPSEEEMAEKLINPVPDLSPDTDGESPIEIEDTYVIDPETATTAGKVKEAVGKTVNLDAVIDTNEKKIIQETEKDISKGGNENPQIEPEQKVNTEPKVEVTEDQKERHTVETGMDLDDLLDNFQPTTK